ncbi:MAG: hypothetical protein DMG36_11390 [Acidobacteria bacterium]|nr:MAG: hypothetical protein DMG36_11390 [Acidobacteriota bacterium]
MEYEAMSDEKEISQVRDEEVERGWRPKHSGEKEKFRRLKSFLGILDSKPPKLRGLNNIRRT